MAWQDIVISLGGVFFAVALTPSLIGEDKPAFKTSIITASILIIMVFTYASLELWLSALMNAIMCVMWGILAVQKYRIGVSK